MSDTYLGKLSEACPAVELLANESVRRLFLRQAAGEEEVLLAGLSLHG